MKKSGEYVTRGAPLPREAIPEPERDEASPEDFAFSPVPAALPRDRGMGRRSKGYHEVPPLSAFVAESLQQIKGALRDAPAAPDAIAAALDCALDPQLRGRVSVDGFDGKTLTLALARRTDRFALARYGVPKLQAALHGALGPIAIRLAVKE